MTPRHREPSRLFSFLRDETGAAAVEYALLTSLLGVAAIFAFLGLQTSLGDLFRAAAATCDPVTH